MPGAPASMRRRGGWRGGNSSDFSFQELLDSVAAGDLAQRELDIVDRKRGTIDLPDAEVAEGLCAVEGERLLVGGRGRIGEGEDQRTRGIVLHMSGGAMVRSMDVAVEHRDVV